MLMVGSRSRDATARIWSIPESRAADVKSTVLIHQIITPSAEEKAQDVTTLDWNVRK